MTKPPQISDSIAAVAAGFDDSEISREGCDRATRRASPRQLMRCGYCRQQIWQGRVPARSAPASGAQATSVGGFLQAP